MVSNLIFLMSQSGKTFMFWIIFETFQRHFNMGVITMPPSLANQLHLLIWHRGNQRFIIWCPCLFLSPTHSFELVVALCFSHHRSLWSLFSLNSCSFYCVSFSFATFLLLCLFCSFLGGFSVYKQILQVIYVFVMFLHICAFINAVHTNEIHSFFFPPIFKPLLLLQKL